jgi:hypothetical protein
MAMLRIVGYDPRTALRLSRLRGLPRMDRQGRIGRGERSEPRQKQARVKEHLSSSGVATIAMTVRFIPSFQDLCCLIFCPPLRRINKQNSAGVGHFSNRYE